MSVLYYRDKDGNLIPIKTITGEDGFSPTVEVSKSGKVTTITITDANGTKTATIKDGEDGAGAEGYTIPDFWTDALNAVIATVKELQVGKNCVTFAHFSDNHTRLGYSGMLIAEVMKECHIPYCFYNGDSIDSGYIASEDVMIAQDAAFDAAMAYIPEGRFCRAVGNHDGFWKVSDSESHTYTRDQVYDLFLREEAAAQNKHFGDDGTYYYVEDLASKVRFVVLNTNGGSVDETQLAWLRDTALKFSESGWAVVMISHQPISNHYNANISNAAAVREIVADSGVEIIGWFSGHIHRDRMYNGAAVNTTDDTEGDAMGFTQVTITSDHTGIAYEDATKHTVADDDKSHAIDFVTINRSTRTVNMTRLGIGNNRVYSYSDADAVLYSITNNLAHVTSSNSVTSIEEGNTYSATLTAVSGYEMSSVVVTMGGTDITATAYADGVVSIAEVTGDIVITATAEAVETEPDTISITWKNGYTCTHAVGSACTETESTNYAVSENIPVAEGKTYVLSRSDGEALTSSSKFNLVELDANGIVVQSIEIKYDGLGANTSYTYNPSSGVTQLKFRGYAAALEEYQKFVLTIG